MPAATGPVPARLFAILARQAPIGVVFRRGPTDLVELIRWDTATDTFERGQWFKGRIYEHRSDLSPDGSLLVYAASKHHVPRDSKVGASWTAISKPPWLTALTLWPMRSPVDWGGGLFRDDESLALSHPADAPHRYHLPRWLRIISMTGVGKEEHPYLQRLSRDGWAIRDRARVPASRYRYNELLQTREKAHGRSSRSLTMDLVCPFEPGSASTVAEFTLEDSTRGVSIRLDDAEWADWDQQGRLVFARDGKLFAGEIGAEGQLRERELADFDADTFEAKQAPAWAREW